VTATIFRRSKEDIDATVKAARNAFDNGPWTRMDHYAKGYFMYRVAELIKKNQT
jgi:aldehyde dehydrogenase (NAD+)